ncbi:MAG: nucleotidyltransferase domain-containing protein [Candidatus Methanoperedens sp.]|nr:nucleotidyltransferase domain-containing protein [Candidatus Methanoperedens sp.]
MILKTLKNIGASAQKIILFGSRARKDFTRFSDYDILIITDRKIVRNALKKGVAL